MSEPISPLDDLGEDIREWAEAQFGETPASIYFATEMKAFVVSLTKRCFGDDGVRKITEVTE